MTRFCRLTALLGLFMSLIVASPAAAQFAPEDCDRVSNFSAPEGSELPPEMIPVAAMPGGLDGEVICYLRDMGTGAIDVLPVEVLPNGDDHFSVLYNQSSVTMGLGHPDSDGGPDPFLWCNRVDGGGVSCTLDLFTGVEAVFHIRTIGVDGALRSAGVAVNAGNALDGFDLRDAFLAADPGARRVAFRLDGVYDGLPMTLMSDDTVVEYRLNTMDAIVQVMEHLESDNSGILVHFAVLDDAGGAETQQLSQPHQIVSILMEYMLYFERAVWEMSREGP